MLLLLLEAQLEQNTYHKFSDSICGFAPLMPSRERCGSNVQYSHSFELCPRTFAGRSKFGGRSRDMKGLCLRKRRFGNKVEYIGTVQGRTGISACKYKEPLLPKTPLL